MGRLPQNDRIVSHPFSGATLVLGSVQKLGHLVEKKLMTMTNHHKVPCNNYGRVYKFIKMIGVVYMSFLYVVV